MPRTFQPARLIALRERADMSREQLAAAARTSWWSIYAWESGKAAPSAKSLPPLADALNVAIDDLFATVETRR